jgi:hypothetical protein
MRVHRYPFGGDIERYFYFSCCLLAAPGSRAGAAERVRDREAAAADPGRIRFSPSILPPYMCRSKSIETLPPILYLKGISADDSSEALAALLGKDAAGLSASFGIGLRKPPRMRIPGSRASMGRRSEAIWPSGSVQTHFTSSPSIPATVINGPPDRSRTRSPLRNGGAARVCIAVSDVEAEKAGTKGVLIASVTAIATEICLVGANILNSIFRAVRLARRGPGQLADTAARVSRGLERVRTKHVR